MAAQIIKAICAQSPQHFSDLCTQLRSLTIRNNARTIMVKFFSMKGRETKKINSLWSLLDPINKGSIKYSSWDVSQVQDGDAKFQIELEVSLYWPELLCSVQGLQPTCFRASCDECVDWLECSQTLFHVEPSPRGIMRLQGSERQNNAWLRAQAPESDTTNRESKPYYHLTLGKLLGLSHICFFICEMEMIVINFK